MQAYPQLVPAFAEEFRYAFSAIDQIRSLTGESESEPEDKICLAATNRAACIIAAHRKGKTAL